MPSSKVCPLLSTSHCPSSVAICRAILLPFLQCVRALCTTSAAVAAAWFLLRRARRRLAGEAVEDEAAEDEAGPAGGALEDEAVEDEAGPAGGAMEDEAAEDEAAEEGLFIKIATSFSSRAWLSKAFLTKFAALSRRCR